VRESAALGDCRVTVIPNPIDVNVWKPVDKQVARELVGVKTEVPLLLFGAYGGSRDSRKGFDLLLKTLEILKARDYKAEILVFGEKSQILIITAVIRFILWDIYTTN